MQSVLSGYSRHSASGLPLSSQSSSHVGKSDSIEISPSPNNQAARYSFLPHSLWNPLKTQEGVSLLISPDPGVPPDLLLKQEPGVKLVGFPPPVAERRKEQLDGTKRLWETQHSNFQKEKLRGE